VQAGVIHHRIGFGHRDAIHADGRFAFGFRFVEYRGHRDAIGRPVSSLGLPPLRDGGHDDDVGADVLYAVVDLTPKGQPGDAHQVVKVVGPVVATAIADGPLDR